jgi:hypothetical protein
MSVLYGEFNVDVMYYPLLLFRRRDYYHGNKNFSLLDDMAESDPKQFTLCVEQQKTVCMKLNICTLFHAIDFLCLGSALEFSFSATHDRNKIWEANFFR